MRRRLPPPPSEGRRLALVSRYLAALAAGGPRRATRRAAHGLGGPGERIETRASPQRRTDDGPATRPQEPRTTSFRRGASVDPCPARRAAWPESSLTTGYPDARRQERGRPAAAHPGILAVRDRG